MQTTVAHITQMKLYKNHEKVKSENETEEENGDFEN